MAKINRYLKSIFIGINILWAIAAGLVVVLVGKFNLWMNPEKDMDIIFTENRLFKQDVLLVEDFLFARAVVCLCGAGILVVACFGIYGVRKETEWPLAVFITGSSIGMITFMMQGVRVTNLRNVIVKYMSETDKRQFLTLEAVIPVSFGFAAWELIEIILASVIIHQLRRCQNGISPPARRRTKPTADTKLSEECCADSTVLNVKDTQSLILM